MKRKKLLPQLKLSLPYNMASNISVVKNSGIREGNKSLSNLKDM